MRTAFLVIANLLLAFPIHAEEGIPANIGNGTYPEGLLNNPDIGQLSKLRIEKLKSKLQVIRARHNAGSVSAQAVYQAQQDLLLAQLESTNDRPQRLRHIEDALRNAIELWQLAKLKSEKGVQGGEFENLIGFEEQIFRFRIMWLKENAEKP